MNLQLLVPTIIAAIVAVVGWMIGHKLNSNRDIKNKQRELRITYLTNAYNAFIETGRSGNIVANYKDVEKAIYHLHLFGTDNN